MSYLPHKTCCPDPVASVAAIPDEANCSWLHQSHHCEFGSCVYIYRQIFNIRHIRRQSDCRSLSANRRCSNYIFILDLTPGLNRLGRNNCETWREIFSFWDSVRLLEVWRYEAGAWRVKNWLRVLTLADASIVEATRSVLAGVAFYNTSSSLLGVIYHTDFVMPTKIFTYTCITIRTFTKSLYKMAAISQTTFSIECSWLKSFVFWFEFHRTLFLSVQLTISEHWCR